MSARQIKAMIAQLERHKKKIGSERDALREIVSEMEGILDDTDEAADSLEAAIDALSRLL